MNFIKKPIQQSTCQEYKGSTSNDSKVDKLPHFLEKHLKKKNISIVLR